MPEKREKPKKQDRAAAALRVILKAVRRREIHPYLSPLKRPRVFLDVGGRPGGCFDLFEPAVKHWLADFAWAKGFGLLRSQELDRILNVLAGRAMATPVTKIDDPALLRVIETEPVVAVVLEYMHVQTTYRVEHTMQRLWELLREFARDRDLLRLGRNRFPGGANVLSRKLSLFAPILARLGITIEIKRSDGCKVTLTRSDDPIGKSSGEPSGNKPGQDKNLSPEDDRERRRARLAARKGLRDSRPHEGGTS